ncbi:LEAF RUST 10 DISEASE-RESISTANCE LOCUS RECEPTOR-LIKE PROTEIN KINASE-like 2.1 [Olea europaea var. sylvestris]|uniref:LEAF RUST 10 DISEASE-RESISTANCE LOCUS RECEPTOR-LIKE PROTEIN KINASE-like 2.1 n=1 Tax=Olea europaea var. sylvestris TaxID=158386 RepID=UPI000C1D0F21|nr:LEAF RUST 10 DISEASE-RESISTANCE LOCUS RECEPTOR-LIKE PROTEIN KINASE-like 2.1 [Olea europaea var. sylvestris]
MHLELNQRYFLHLISLVLILYVPGSLCQNGGEEYVTCGAPYRCGDIQNITYPFWGGTRPDYCGLSDFQLNCQGDVAFLNISSTQYRVLEINNTTQTIQVAREDLWNTTCPSFLYNTTLNLNLFTPSPDYRNVTIYYGCSSNGQPTQLPNQFSCDVNGTNTESFYAMGEVTDPGSTIRCNSSINVLINQSLLALPTASVPRLLQDAFASGFSLQWEANNRICLDCIGSGGLCGTNRESGSFACYCANRTSALTCNDAPTGNGMLQLLSTRLRILFFLKKKNLTIYFSIFNFILKAYLMFIATILGAAYSQDATAPPSSSPPPPVMPTGCGGLNICLEEALVHGFSVNYREPFESNCSKRNRFGGQCGFDSGLGQPVCICNDRPCPFALTTPQAYLAGNYRNKCLMLSCAYSTLSLGLIESARHFFGSAQCFVKTIIAGNSNISVA